MLKKSIVKGSKGITLIALVITIIVLLILAGVTIAMLTGENGILTQANDAKIKTEEAKEDELRKLTQAEAATHLENHLYKGTYNGEEMTVTIPAGFAVSQVNGENTIDEGLVIIDKNGNEFVWVPFTGSEEEFIRYEGYNNGNKQSYLSNCTEPFSGAAQWEIDEYNKMKQSVLDNDGFYVARYEAGKENIDGTDKIVSKKGATVWNNIPWGESITEIGTNGAVYQSQQMYTDKNNYGVTSTLIYGVQWDTIMSWIDPEYKTGTCDTNTSFVANSTGKGNQTGEMNLSGDNDEYKVKNIYDLAGNVWEWTMETYSTNSRVVRGESYKYTENKITASRRDYDPPGFAEKYIGFRPALYL